MPFSPPAPQIPPGLLAPPPPPSTPAARVQSRPFAMAGVALVLAAITMLVVLVATRAGGPALIAMPIHTVPPGAEVLINGAKQANATPIEAMLPIGKNHKIELRLRGYKTVVQDILPIEGVKPSVNVTLLPMLGKITFEVEPRDARVSINGKLYGTVAEAITGLEADQDFLIKIDRAGFKSYTQMGSLSEDRLELVVKATLEKQP